MTLDLHRWRSRFRAMVLVPLAAGLLSACSSPSIDRYAGTQPTLDLRTYFNGKLRAHGLFQDRSGEVIKRFVVEMDGQWNGDEGVLDEHFTYADGTKDRRVWRLKYLGNGRYTGTADDVVGEASGQTQGHAFRWQYTLNLPVDGTTYEVQFDDWMYLIDDHTMLNHAKMSKWGIHLGEVILSFSKP
ncbi:MAG: hypothetical protein RL357_1225 [Pseudomonadota bacterium]